MRLQSVGAFLRRYAVRAWPRMRVVVGWDCFDGYSVMEYSQPHAGHIEMMFFSGATWSGRAD